MNAFRGFLHNPCGIRILYDKKIYIFSTPQDAEEFYKTLPRQAAATEEPSEWDELWHVPDAACDDHRKVA